MARYFFNLHECGTVTVDEEGFEQPDLGAARIEALRAARDVMCAEVSEGRLCLGCCIEVVDVTGQVVMSVPFREAITITGL